MKLPTKVGSALQADRLNRVEPIVPEVAWQFRREAQSQFCRRQKPEWVGDFFTAEAQRTPRDGRGGARPYRSSGIESRGLPVPANPTRHKMVVVNFTILEKRIEGGCDFWDKGRMQGWAWLLVMAAGIALSGCGKKSESAPQAAAEAAAKRTDDLPTDPEEKYKTAYVRSAQAFSRNDLEGAIKFLDIAEQSKPGQANTANLRGAIYTRQRDWPKAQAAFEEALQLQPDLPMAQFNLGEVLFLNNKYKEARERFQIFLNSQPKNDLGLYKIYLCDLLGDNKAKAQDFLNSLEPSPSSPIYYFSKAAEAFVKGDKAAAMEFVGSAYRIYPPDANATFADSLVEKGYLTGEQAEKIPEEDGKAKVTELQTLLPGLKKEEDKKSVNLLPAKP